MLGGTLMRGLMLQHSPLSPSGKLRRRAPPPPPCTAFDETLIAGLKSLPPLPPSVTLAWLSAAADLLSSTLYAAADLISDLTPTSSDLIPHLDASNAILDACNEIRYLLNGVSRRRLLLRLALRVLPDRPRARVIITEFEAPPEAAPRPIRTNLIPNLRRSRSDPPRNISVVRCAIYVVEALAALVAGAALVVLGGAAKPDFATFRASTELPWAEAFNKIAAGVYERLGSRGVSEVEATERRVRDVAVMIDSGEEGVAMSRAVEGTKSAMEKLTEKLERLSTAVNGVFRAEVSVRDCACPVVVVRLSEDVAAAGGGGARAGGSTDDMAAAMKGSPRREAELKSVPEEEHKAINAPEGFLLEWWSVFWDIYIAKTNGKSSPAAATYIKEQNSKATQQHHSHSMHQHGQLRRGHVNYPALDDPMVPLSSNDRGAKIRQVVQGTCGQQILARTQNPIDINGQLDVAQRSLHDPSLIFGQGFNKGDDALPLNGPPTMGVDQSCPSLRAQVQQPFMPTTNNSQLMSLQQQKLAQAQAQGRVGNSSMLGDMDLRRYMTWSRSGLNLKDGQHSGNEGSVSSPVQSIPLNARQDPTENPVKMTHFAQPSEEHLQRHQQPQQNTRKRKQPATSGAANNTDTGNTIGPSNSLPSTPSTHMPEDSTAMAGNVHHLNNSQKSPLMFEFNGAGRLASPANQMDGSGHLDFSVDSYFSNGYEGRDGIPADENEESSKGFGLTEVSRIHTSNKVGCVHFSSDGKFLANAGHEKKVILWIMDTAETKSSLEEHSQIITDICFRPNSTQLVTSSFDRTVRLWDATELSVSKHTFIGHESNVTSVDFHPNKTDLLCSCDRNGEIRFWNADQCSHISTSKGASAKLRFHPRIGELMAASAENMVSVFDFETNMKKLSYQGHEKVVQSLCWDSNGGYLASLCQDYVKVWSLISRECIHELRSHGNKFQSCVFHLSYPGVMVIGGYQTFDLWDMAQNKKITMPAHDGMVSDLAQSSVCGMIASASHDNSVKIWKPEY